MAKVEKVYDCIGSWWCVMVYCTRSNEAVMQRMFPSWAEDDAAESAARYGQLKHYEATVTELRLGTMIGEANRYGY